MVFRFRFISSEAEDFIRDIDIRDDQSFLDLHNALQESVGYDSSSLSSFFLATECWHKEQEITLLEMEDDKPVMEHSLLKDYIKKDKQKLLYVFDYFRERTFFAELIGKYEPKEDKEFPYCSFRQGEAPPQLKVSDS